MPAPSENNGISFRAGLLINSKNTLSINYNYRGSELATPEFATGCGLRNN